MSSTREMGIEEPSESFSVIIYPGETWRLRTIDGGTPGTIEGPTEEEETMPEMYIGTLRLKYIKLRGK